MNRNVVPLLLTGALAVSLSAPALAAGGAAFTDVPADAWFAPNVQAAYELDLMTGSSATTFNPNGNRTIAEARVLAGRLHSTYVGDGETFAASGGTWYQPYVDYAVNNDIVSAGAYANYTATATRAQFAAILAAVALVAASMLFSWFIGLSSRYSLVYGSLASVIILLVWLYLCGNILILGNVFNYVWYKRKKR